MAQTKEGAIKLASKYYKLEIDVYIELIKTHKHCKSCKIWKTKDNFCKDRSRMDGFGTACYECRRVKERKTTKGRPSPFKGKKHTKETKFKISLAGKGKAKRPKGWHHSEETKKKISLIMREKSKKGSDCYNWKGGITSENGRIRKSERYKEWRKNVFERDNYICQKCGDNKGGNLNAHHIKSFADYVELRFDVDNGITYCEKCHCEIHHKPYSIRNRKRKRYRTVGITGFYQLSVLGLKYFERKNSNPNTVADSSCLIECACGCGNKITPFDKYDRKRIYISGHNFSPSTTQDAIYKVLINGPNRLSNIVKCIPTITKQAVKVALCKMKKKQLVEYKKLT